MSILNVIKDLQILHQANGCSDDQPTTILIGHGMINHRPVLHHILTSLPNFLEKSPPSILLICLDDDPDIYASAWKKKSLFSSLKVTQQDNKSEINVTIWDFMSQLESHNYEDFDHIESIVNEINNFLNKPCEGERIIVIDNILAMTEINANEPVEAVQRCTRMMTHLFDQAYQKNCRLVIGCHAGEHLPESTNTGHSANYTEADLVADEFPITTRFLNRLISVSDLCIHLRTLKSGYTQSLDGQISIVKKETIKAHNDDHLNWRPWILKTVDYHYKYEGKNMVFYPKGTSSLVS